MVDVPYEIFVDSVGKIFIEISCICVCKGSKFIIPILCWVFMWFGYLVTLVSENEWAGFFCFYFVECFEEY